MDIGYLNVNIVLASCIYIIYMYFEWLFYVVHLIQCVGRPYDHNQL